MERANNNKASWAYVEAGYRSSSLAFVQAIPERGTERCSGIKPRIEDASIVPGGGLRTAIQIANAR